MPNIDFYQLSAALFYSYNVVLQGKMHPALFDKSLICAILKKAILKRRRRR